MTYRAMNSGRTDYSANQMTNARIAPAVGSLSVGRPGILLPSTSEAIANKPTQNMLMVRFLFQLDEQFVSWHVDHPSSIATCANLWTP